MLNKLLIVLFLFVIHFSQGFSISLNKDSLVNPQEIVFQTEIEKSTFLRYIDDSTSDNFLKTVLLTASQTSMDEMAASSKKLNDFALQMKNERIDAMKEKKKIKFIYDKVHSTFLKLYVNPVYFSSIFKDGTYNCVTASALFAYVFDELHIPYVIMESSDHVFLLTYPKTLNISVETTNPISGSYSYNSKMQETYVNYLKSNKIISEEESKQKSVSELFKSYFFHENSINEKRLAGLQYYNGGIEKMTTGKFAEAYSQFEKAYALYPSKKMTFFSFLCLAELISQANYSDSLDVHYLANASHYKNLGISESNMRAEFYRLTNNILIDRSDFVAYDKAYKYLLCHINDDIILNDLKFIYSSEEARIYFNKENYPQALELASAAIICDRQMQIFKLYLCQRSIRLFQDFRRRN